MSLKPQYISIRITVLLFGILLFFEAMAASDGHKACQYNQLLETIEISDISMGTPEEKIADILSEQGYTPVNSTLYTKQDQLQKARKTIYRIEVENTADYRQITYHRSLSGGRVKSFVDDKPIPASELEIARQLYHIACEDASEKEKVQRQCEPPEQTNMNVGYGDFIDINACWAVQLSATAANTAIGIRYSYE